MRRLMYPLVLAVLSALLPVAGASQATGPDVSGSWVLTWETPRGPQSATFVFTQDAAAVTGHAVLRTREVPLKDGAMEEARLTFTLELGGRQRPLTQTFTATVSGDSMEGTVTTPRGERPFQGTRQGG